MTKTLKQQSDISPQQFAIHPQRSVWVNASAGSGKTKTLTDRVLALLLSGAKPSSILCLTFTKAAASEMLDRVMAKLKEWSVQSDKKKLSEELDYYVEVVEEETYQRAKSLFHLILEARQEKLSIDTIHSFCQRLLKNFPFEAGVSPTFTILGEQEAQGILQQTLSEILQSGIYQDPELAEQIEFFSKYLHDQQFYEFLQRLVSEYPKLARSLRYFETTEQLQYALAKKLSIDPNLTEEKLQQNFVGHLTQEQRHYEQLADDLSLEGSATDKDKALFIKNYFSGNLSEVDPWLLIEFFLTGKRDQSQRKIRKNFVTAKWAKSYPEHQSWLEDEAHFILNWMDDVHSLIIFQSTLAIYKFTHYFVDQYETAKQMEGALDYDDLIEKALTLLQDPDVANWVLYKFDQKIDHILVDEAQDTNPQQWHIIQKLCEDFLSGLSSEKDKTLFVVGDAKQSIFRFQGADIDIYYDVHDQFAEFSKQANREWHNVDLPTNYRSHPEILTFVDQCIDKISPQKLGLQLDKVQHHAFREKREGGVILWPLFETQVQDAPVAWKPPVEKEVQETSRSRLAASIASEIEILLSEKRYLPSKDRSIEPKDIMVLVRRRSGFVEELTRSLKQKKIPVMGSDRLILNNQLIVMDLMALAKFILLAEDDLNLATLLKSPLCNLSEEDIFKLCHDRGSKTLWQRLLAVPEFEETSCFLNELRQARPQTLFAFFCELLARPVNNYTTAKEAFLTRLGSDQLDVLQEFLNLVHQYEQNNLSSLQYFVKWFESQQHILKRELDHQLNQVQILTIHGSKGLQAPIVFLPDTSQKPRAVENLLWDEEGHLLWIPKTAFHTCYTKPLLEEWKTQQAHEYYRLLYVALTRAEDYLYLSGWQTQQKIADDSWYSLLNEVYQESSATKKAA